VDGGRETGEWFACLPGCRALWLDYRHSEIGLTWLWGWGKHKKLIFSEDFE
jgi:hypothetical protein